MAGTEKSPRLTRLLQAAARGEAGAPDALLSLVYEELRKIARARMADERRGHTLQATDLVHEAYLKLIGGRREGAPGLWENRSQFYRAAAAAMRRILIDHARRRGRQKRGGGRRVFSDVLDLAAEQDPEEIRDLDEALERLSQWDPRLGELVRLRFFAGLSIEETAAALGVSERTARRDWTFARAWLYDALQGGGPERP